MSNYFKGYFSEEFIIIDNRNIQFKKLKESKIIVERYDEGATIYNDNMEIILYAEEDLKGSLCFNGNELPIDIICPISKEIIDDIIYNKKITREVSLDRKLKFDIDIKTIEFLFNIDYPLYNKELFCLRKDYLYMIRQYEYIRKCYLSMNDNMINKSIKKSYTEVDIIQMGKGIYYNQQKIHKINLIIKSRSKLYLERLEYKKEYDKLNKDKENK